MRRDGFITKSSSVHGEEIMLDLRFATLFGFQNGVDKKKIDSMLESIANNSVFPAVKIVKNGSNDYSMAFLYEREEPDGGHHRAYSHFLADKPLRCEIVPEKYKAEHANIPIQDIDYRRFSDLWGLVPV